MPKNTNPTKNWNDVDWNNPSSKISKYFTVKEAIYLRNWKRLATSEDGLNDNVKKNLFIAFQKLDEIREFLNIPIYVKSSYRPSKYNIAIGGASKSAHMANKTYAAIDWWTDIDGDGDKDGSDCDQLKVKLMPHLKKWGLRMEDNGKGARWIHNDTKKVGYKRFFKP